MTMPLSLPVEFPDVEAQLEQMAQEAIAQMKLPLTDEDATPSEANEILKPNPPEYARIPEGEEPRALAKALYGSDFPPLLPESNDTDWASWVRGRWTSHSPAVERHLHLVERNRLFRAGQQWVSSRGRGPWREPMRPVDSARLVYNLVDKALDQRLQIISDQRPGFKVDPFTSDPGDRRKAEARQMAVEHQYETQDMDALTRVATYWAQTDGVSFLHTFWDPDRGPWDSRMGSDATPSGPLGDLNTVVARVEQVRVSSQATATVPPYYAIIREVIPAMEAAWRYGISGVEATNDSQGGAVQVATDTGMNRWVLDQTVIGEGDRLRQQETVERFTVYIAKNAEIMPEGLQLVIVGDQMVTGPLPLLFGVIPVTRVGDGSSDPSYYPRPIMEQWIDHQVRINVMVSKWADAIRVNAAGRFLMRAGTIITETMVGGGTSVLEVNRGGRLDDVIQPVPGFSVGADLKELLQLDKKAFEDASGYNDTSRGQISGEASGRAILAAREQLERVFAPCVTARAQALTEWARIQIAGMAFGYDVPRDLAATGNGRPDLAHALTRELFEGPASIKVDPETLMPMPRVYRQFLLDGWLEKGVITPQQYMRRQSTALTRDISTPDEDQEARAQRICEAIRQGIQVPELRWQDNEAIQQDVLERQILLQDDVTPEVLAVAQERWVALSQQAATKTGSAPPMMPPAGPPAGPGGTPMDGGVPPSAPSPQTQPLAPAAPAGGAAPPPSGAGDPAMHNGAIPTMSP